MDFGDKNNDLPPTVQEPVQIIAKTKSKKIPKPPRLCEMCCEAPSMTSKGKYCQPCKEKKHEEALEKNRARNRERARQLARENTKEPQKRGRKPLSSEQLIESCEKHRVQVRERYNMKKNLGKEAKEQGPDSSPESTESD
jgi:hypothetical protein